MESESESTDCLQENLWNLRSVKSIRCSRTWLHRFVHDQLIPLEPTVLEREASGRGTILTPEERASIDKKSHELGLWGLDAPAEVGGSDLPTVAMIGVDEEIGETVTPYTLPPDSPNLRMLWRRSTMISASAISNLMPVAKRFRHRHFQPGAGADPAAMITRAVRDGDDWVINGRKIWVSRAAEADFTIVMAVTDKAAGARGGISAFLVDKGTPGFNSFADSHDRRRLHLRDRTGGLPDTCQQMLGKEGHGFAPMQLRLSTRRVQMASWCVGLSQAPST